MAEIHEFPRRPLRTNEGLIELVFEGYIRADDPTAEFWGGNMLGSLEKAGEDRVRAFLAQAHLATMLHVSDERGWDRPVAIAVIYESATTFTVVRKGVPPMGWRRRWWLLKRMVQIFFGIAEGDDR